VTSPILTIGGVTEIVQPTRTVVANLHTCEREISSIGGGGWS